MNSTQNIFGKTFALFPGQGSQHVGMGKDLFDNFKIAREIFEEASDASHLNLKKLCFEGPESDLVLTEHTQPCLLTSSVAAFRVTASETGFHPKAMAGHSLGEYSALVCAGAITLGQAALWVRERGKAMQLAVPAGQGTMAAIMGLEDHQVETLCKKASLLAHAKRAHLPEGEEYVVEATVQPANFNAPGQIVIAGSTDAVREAIILIKEGNDFKGGKAIPLSVSAPFHSKLMAPARNRMAELFAQAPKAKSLSSPYVPNRTGRLTSEAGVVFELLIEQVDHPVLWKQSVSALLETGLDTAVEFGPGKVLTGLVKRIGQPLGKTCALNNIADSTQLKAFEAVLKASLKPSGQGATP